MGVAELARGLRLPDQPWPHGGKHTFPAHKYTSERGKINMTHPKAHPPRREGAGGVLQTLHHGQLGCDALT